MQPKFKPVLVILTLAECLTGAMTSQAQEPRGPLRREVAPADRQTRPASAVRAADTRASDSPSSGVRPAAPRPPRAPFELTVAQQKRLDEILKKWEQTSDNISTFKCDFEKMTYDPTFGMPKSEAKNDWDITLRSTGKGEVKYKAPDHGIYIETSMAFYDSMSKKFVSKPSALEHWHCDGEAIFQFLADQKKLIERKLPPEMRGQAISDGPLPFIFGANAERLKQRYFMRETTPPDQAGEYIWLEAWPRFEQDAANFQRAELILTKSNYLPYALQSFMPGSESAQYRETKIVYRFTNRKVNDTLKSWLTRAFAPPETPRGWTREVVPAGGAEQPPATPPSDPGQARRGTSSRK